MKDWQRNSAPRPEGYFLYHSIGMYPGKEEELAAAMAEFAAIYGAPDDKQWGYMLRKRQDFIDHWRHIIGAEKGSVTACDSVTQGVHSIVTALPEARLRGKRLLIAEDCFPSVHFLLAGLQERLGFTLDTVPKRDGATWVEDDDFIAAWGPDVGLALITWVTSTASYRCDLDRLVAHGRERGSMIGVDITQAAGLVPFDVMAPRIDFAISTSLKWMCGTPGAGMIYVDKPLIPEFEPELRGWFSQNNPFSWALDKFQYAPDARRFDSGTPASMAAIASVPALKWHAAQDRAKMLRHNRDLVDRIIERADALNLPLQSPREAERRGGSVMLRMPSKAEAGAVTGALGVEGISVDFRDALMRLSPGVLTRADEVERAFDIVARTMKRRTSRFAGRMPEGATAPAADPKAVLAGLAGALSGGGLKVVDCTAPLGPDTPILRLPKGFAKDTPKVEIHKISEYDADGPFFAWNWLKLGEHSGTHFDAPHHWLSGKDFPDGFTDTLDVQRLIAPANVIDCSADCAADSDFLLDVDRVRAWEAQHGEIRPGEWVLMRSDWDRRAEDEEAFLNDDPDPLEDGSHSPGPTTQCIDYLLSKGIVGWGSQCIGTDAGMAGKFSPPYPAHNYLHRDNCFGLASLANLDQLPPKGAILIVTPLKIERGTGSPVRALALVPGNATQGEAT
ncbi:aminotransferase class V-fold PLP-dependent enzyme [Sulfitobacter sp. D35]|uniref:aminotransferase class V-fold PLP-dependent enzyme n=1 Tax=Sulfitobacter sp. D35 TaxID=3083252 RepID=UPI00296E608C|nr:aminotransferase class V-fold PLP-dependent enzyme [Sulfitobacter sp. D35]MDW4500338.1 aminotransferase class V-fold PLP-dependent enzyme [Sulfitobacter sp. D35]